MKKRILTGVLCVMLATIMIAVLANNASAGGGPMQGCYISTWPPVLQGNPGDTIAFEAYVGACPATLTINWSDTDPANDETIQLNQTNGVYWETLDVPSGITNDTVYQLSATASQYGLPSYQTTIPVAVGNPPVYSLELSLSLDRAYWGSYAAYQNRTLSIDYSIANVGSNDAYEVSLTTDATNGVVPLTPSWMLTDKIEAGKSYAFTMDFTVPEGVTFFRSMHAATAEDAGANWHSFGSLPPGS